MKTLKIIAYLAGSLSLLLIIALAFFHFKGIPDYTYDPPAEVVRLQVPPDSAHIARGAAIGAMHCVACHAGEDGKLTGKIMDDLPPMFGRIHSLNITQDPVHGIGAWTDGELYYFLRTGIHRDGTWSPPFMPKYSLMADEDLYSVIAWLRSDDPRLAPDSREFPPNEYNLLLKVLGNTISGPPPFPADSIAIPDTTDKVAYGKYVADALSNCYMCHSGDMLKVNGLQPELSYGYYAGGIPLRNAEGREVITANLTMDMETGLGKWTEQQFVDAVRYCKKPDGTTLAQPMGPHWMLSEQEVKAIWAYLQTLPPVHNPINRYKP